MPPPKTAISRIAPEAMPREEKFTAWSDAVMVVDNAGQAVFANTVAELIVGRSFVEGTPLEEWVAGTPLEVAASNSELERHGVAIRGAGGISAGRVERFSLRSETALGSALESRRQLQLLQEIDSLRLSNGGFAEGLSRVAGMIAVLLDVATVRVWVGDDSANQFWLLASAGSVPDGPEPIADSSSAVGFIDGGGPRVLRINETADQVPARQWAQSMELAGYAMFPMVAEGRVVGGVELYCRDSVSRQSARVLQLAAARLGQWAAEHFAGHGDGPTSFSGADYVPHPMRAVFNAANIYLGILAPDGTLLEANDVSFKFGETRREEEIGRPFCECVWFHHTPGAPEQVRDLVQRAAAGEMVQVELRLLRPSGEERWFEMTLCPVIDDHGKVISIVPQGHDVTLRKRGEEATTRLAAIVDSSKDAIISADMDRRITSWNRGAEQLLGYTASEAIGQELGMLIPDDRSEEEEVVLSRLSQGMQINNFETVRLRNDGTRIDVSLSVSPLRDHQNRIVGISKIARDITEHKRAIERLQESEERLRTAVDVAQLGTITLDFQAGTATPDTTGAHLFGLRPHEGVSIETLRSRFHGEGEDRLGRLLCETLAPGEDFLSQEHCVRLPDGGIRWLNLQQRNFYGETDMGLRSLRGILAAIDITDRKQFEESLEQAREAAEAANRSRGEFLANMSHEIRTPMTAILGHADILREHLRDPDDVQAVETIRRNGRFLLEIVNDILDLSKIDAGRMQIERERVRPEVLMGDIRSLMDVRAREQRVELEFEFDGRIPATIETDAVRLRQILLNLIGNAIKFTDEGSVRVVVRYVQGLNQMQFDIVDTGIGIAPDDILRLFRPFTQADASNTREHGGTGLGLAISRRLARALGGDISVESRLGEGSIFQLAVDCGLTNGVPLIEPLFHVSEQPLSHDVDLEIEGHILIVDDRRDIRFLAQHFVEKSGGTVTTATNGREAIERVQEAEESGTEIDLVLLDMQMPVMDGYAAAVALRQRGFTKPIIALTANAMKEDRDKCLAAGCNDYIAKPLDGDELIRMMETYLCASTPRQTQSSAKA